MNDVQMEKFHLVKDHLTPALKYATDGEVRKCTYRVDGSKESVVITYSNGWTRRVNVTADSMPALMRDVLKHI